MLSSGKYYFVNGTNDVEIGAYNSDRDEFMSLFTNLDSLAMMATNSGTTIKNSKGDIFSVALFYALMKNIKFYTCHTVGFNYDIDLNNQCIIIPSIGLSVKMEKFKLNNLNDNGGWYSFALGRYFLTFDEKLFPYYDTTKELLNDVLSEIICQYIMENNLDVEPDVKSGVRFITLEVEHVINLGYRFSF